MQLPLSALLLYLIIMVAAAVDDHPYCALRYRRLCQGKGRHVGCQFPDPGPSEYCTNYTKIKFTGDVRNFITNYINRHRQRIASGTEKVRGGVLLPKPGIMMLVEWDRELAFLSERFADQCNFAHDECRATVRYPYAGQTVGEVRLRRSSESDELTAQRAIRRVFDAWWGEKRRVLPIQLMTPFKLDPKGTVWGHFSQLAVWTLRAVGCGAVRHGERYPHLLLVCDFSHTNMLGQRTLPPGPLEPCPPHTARKPRTAYPLLCAAVRRPVTSNMEINDDLEKRLNDDQNVDNEEDERKYLDTDNMTRKFGIYVKVSSRRPFKEINKATRLLYQLLRGPVKYLVFFCFLDLLVKGQLKATIDRWSRTKEKQQNVKQNNNLGQNSRFDNQSVRKVLGGRPPSLYSGRPLIRVEQFEEMAPAYERNPEDRYAFRHNVSLRPSAKMTAYETSSDSLLVRHRWKYTKDRPKRPGANALLNKPTAVIQARRPSIASLLLDKEDVDQFIRDTGFNPQWRAHTK